MQIWYMQQLVPTCQWSFLVGWRRFLAALPKQLVKSSQAGRMLFYIFLPIPLLCSRNQLTSAIFAKAWPYKNGWMKWHEYTYELVLQACLFRATKLGAWAIQSQCQRRPCQGCIETFSSQPWANANHQVLFHCIQVMRNGHVPRHGNYGKHSSCRCSVGRIMVKCMWNVMTI